MKEKTDKEKEAALIDLLAVFKKHDLAIDIGEFATLGNPMPEDEIDQEEIMPCRVYEILDLSMGSITTAVDIQNEINRLRK